MKLLLILLLSILCVPLHSIKTPSFHARHHLSQSHKLSKLNHNVNFDVISQSQLIVAKNIELPNHHHKGMSVTALVINIIADLCPHGMLPLAYGFAQGGPSGVVPSVAILLLFGLMSAYSMISYVKLAAATNSNSISEIWAKLVGRKYEMVVDFAIFSLCFGCCVFYSSFMGDIFGSLTIALGIPKPSMLASRWFILSVLSAGVLLPLCSLEDLSALEYSSFLGVISIAYTVMFHVYRLFDGSYSPALKHTTGSMLKFLSTKLQPHWTVSKLPMLQMNEGTLVLANMACVAFLAHYNAISYFKELHNPTLKRYSKSIVMGFTVALGAFLTMMFTGYKLFGMTAQPLLLNNFPSTADPLASIARLAIGVAITLAYPLMFTGLKSSLFNIFDKLGDNTQWSERYHSLYNAIIAPPVNHEGDKLGKLKKLSIVVVLGVITGIAIQCSEEDVSIVLGLVGSVLGCLVAYVLPGVLTLQDMMRGRLQSIPPLVDKTSTGEFVESDDSNVTVKAEESVVALAVTHYTRVEILLHVVLVVMGTLFGASGVWVTLKTAAAHVTHH